MKPNLRISSIILIFCFPIYLHRCSVKQLSRFLKNPYSRSCCWASPYIILLHFYITTIYFPWILSLSIFHVTICIIVSLTQSFLLLICLSCFLLNCLFVMHFVENWNHYLFILYYLSSNVLMYCLGKLMMPNFRIFFALFATFFVHASDF